MKIGRLEIKVLWEKRKNPDLIQVYTELHNIAQEVRICTEENKIFEKKQRKQEEAIKYLSEIIKRLTNSGN